MPSKHAVYPLRLDPELRTWVVERAGAAGMSVNAFISFALAAFISANSSKLLGRGSYLLPILHHAKTCPCGSGKKYRDCCREHVLRGERRKSEKRLRISRQVTSARHALPRDQLPESD